MQNKVVSSPRPVRPHETAHFNGIGASKAEEHDLLPQSNDLAPSKALGHLDNLMSQMNAAANEASELAQRQSFHTPASSPFRPLEISGDGSSDDYPNIETPEMLAREDSPIRELEEREPPQVPERFRKQLPTHRVYRPRNSTQREREPTILLNSPYLYPKGGTADLYYRDWAYSNRDAKNKHGDTEAGKRLEDTHLPQKKRKQSMYVERDEQRDQGGYYAVADNIPVSPLGRTSMAPLPWVQPAEFEPELGVKHLKTEKLHDNVHKPSVSSSEPLLAFTKHGHISHVRHQPIARKWKKSRKRFTAAVTCINTFVVGFQIGIYVSYIQLDD
jgi:hypothetical protein